MFHLYSQVYWEADQQSRQVVLPAETAVVGVAADTLQVVAVVVGALRLHTELVHFFFLAKFLGYLVVDWVLFDVVLVLDAPQN
jgi:hypothetical protein